jgi:hypothetical protein
MIIAVPQFIIIVAAATWYFSHGSDIEEGDGKKKTGTRAKIWKGIWWIFKYHLGSLALGSLILGIVWLGKVCTNYLRRRLANQRAGDTTERIKYCLLCTVTYYMRCINRFIKFITRNAYIQIAINSTNFFVSAFTAWMLIL